MGHSLKEYVHLLEIIYYFIIINTYIYILFNLMIVTSIEIHSNICTLAVFRFSN